MEEFFTFDDHWAKYKKHSDKCQQKNYSLTKTIVYWLVPLWYKMFIFFLLANLLNIGNPFLLKAFIDWIEEEDPEDLKGWLIWIGISLIAIVKAFFNQHGMRAGFKTMLGCMFVFYGLYFRKLENI